MTNNSGLPPFNNDKQKQIDQYTQAFDSLRNSINSLSQPLNSFSNNLNSLDKNLSKYTDSINKLNAQNEELASSGDKAENKLSDLSNSFATWGNVITLVTTTLKGWQIALTGGLAIITTFAPEIIKFVSALFKGKDAIDKAKLSLDSLNKGLSSTDYSNAIQNVNDLTIKVALAKKGFGDKSAVVKEYNATMGQAIGQVKSLDQVETMLKNNAPGYIQAMLYKATAIAAIKEAADNEILAQKEMAKSDKESVDYMLSGLPETDSAYKNNAERNRTAAAKPFQDKADALLKTAAHYDKLSAIIEQNNPINKIKNQIEDLKKLTDAGVVGSKTFKDIERLQKELDQLNGVVPINNTQQTPKKEKHHPTKEELAANEKAYRDSLTRQLQDTANAFAKKVELEHNNYTTEHATLKSLLDNKLISQEQYHRESEQLEEKYHIGMGEIVKRMNHDDLAKVQQQQKELVDAQQQKELIDKDQHNIDKAILPGQKLAAEKQLITDKYNFEIQKAAEAGQDTLEIRQKYQEEITLLTQKYEQQRKDFALQTAQKVSDTAFSIVQNNIKSQSDAKIKGLEQDKAAELSNKSLTITQKQLIEAKYQKQENAEKVKAFKAEQKASILQAVINGALAVTKATSQTGVLAAFVIPGIIAETAIQVATIAAQKAPQYAQGGLHYQSDGRGALLPGYSRTDNTNAYLRSGEAVVVSDAMRNPWARNLVSAINVAHGGRDFSLPSTGNGYAIGGIFTDGGNANRYYNQPVNDVKDLANTLAYQMINNFPPVYVDVKDINNQQNILAQTVNRVNL